LTVAQKARDEVTMALREFRETVIHTLNETATNQQDQLSGVLDQLAKLTDKTETKLEEQKISVGARLKEIQADSTNSAKEMREEVKGSLKDFNDSVLKGMNGMAESQQNQMDSFSSQLGKLTDSNEQKLDDLKRAVEGKLDAIQEDNARQLDQMRATVDEKLQGTLEKRLGESFKQVSDRLEQVYKGLGEMQALATGVGDLKKVLTNVKARGTWGEVQLGAMLEEVLTPEQYATNVATKEGGERVEFAIKLPGRNEDKDDLVWLPIDAKFPMEHYQRLVDAQEKGDADVVEDSGKQLELRIKQCAKDISEKYLNPPKTTDFGILFLPAEGLFAEVIRRPGLADHIQREYRVMIAGPTTLWSILNSLQMGFRTLAIQKRSSEVWNLLAAVKTEWTKYGEVLDKVQKKLHEASDSIEKAQTRTRAIGRKLRNVQELPAGEAQGVLMVESGIDNFEVEVDEVSSMN
jgi:DNA recombination protein RmuC